MTYDTTSLEEEKDLKMRQELQTKLQEAIRRSAPKSDISKIESEIGKLNQKLESRSNRVKPTKGF